MHPKTITIEIRRYDHADDDSPTYHARVVKGAFGINSAFGNEDDPLSAMRVWIETEVERALDQVFERIRRRRME